MPEPLITYVVVRRVKLRDMEGAPEGRSRRTWSDVATDVLDEISRGRWLVGQQLPGTRDRDAYGASEKTVRKALRWLVGLGVVEARGEAGFYVLTVPARAQTPSGAAEGTRLDAVEARLAVVEGELERQAAELRAMRDR